MILFFFITSTYISYIWLWYMIHCVCTHKTSWSRGLWAWNLEPNYLSLQCRCLSPGDTVRRMWSGCASYRCAGELHGISHNFSIFVSRVLFIPLLFNCSVWGDVPYVANSLNPTCAEAHGFRDSLSDLNYLIMQHAYLWYYLMFLGFVESSKMFWTVVWFLVRMFPRPSHLRETISNTVEDAPPDAARPDIRSHYMS